MKKHIISAILLFIVLAANAQILDKKAIAILDAVSAKTKSYKTLKIEFKYTMDNKTENIHENMNGVVFIKGGKYNLDIAGQNVICDGKTMWTYIKDAQEVQINNIPTDEESISPDKLLTSYNKDYKSKYIKQTVQNGVTVDIIDLVPVKGKKIYKVRLLIDSNKKLIVSSTLYNKNGATFTYEVTKFTADLTINDSKFTFKASDYPGVEVIDMR